MSEAHPARAIGSLVSPDIASLIRARI